MMGVIATSVGVWIGALSGADSPERDAALDSLFQAGQVQEIAHAVYKEKWRTREGLIGVLERLRAVSALTDIATRHSKLDAQRLAIRSLGRTKSEAARITLRDLLASEHRDLAVEALGLLGDQSDIIRVRALLQDERSDVRRRAALALVQLTGSESIDDLVLLLGDPHHSVRFAMLAPLLSFGQGGAEAVVAVYPDLPLVGKVLALRLFGQLHFEPAQPILKDALMGDVWQVQLAAVHAIDFWREARWVPILKTAENNVSAPVVLRAIQDVAKQLE